MFETSLEFTGNGTANISERGGSGGESGYETTSIFSSNDIGDVQFSVGVDEDTAGGNVEFRLKTYHVLDESSGRVFHSYLSCEAGLSDIRKLYAYLGFLIAAIGGSLHENPHLTDARKRQTI